MCAATELLPNHRMMDEDEGGSGSRLGRKMKEDPLMTIGMAGWCGIVAYGLYGLKNRKQPLAMHLIHTRVIAQGFVVSALSVGVGYKIFKEHIQPKIWPVESDVGITNGKKE